MFDFIKTNNLDIINLQEHNLKNKKYLIDMFYYSFHVYINDAINLKGGTAILIGTTITNNIVKVKKNPDSRIISLRFINETTHLHILNIYNTSGSDYYQDYETLYRNEILYYQRNNTIIQLQLLMGILTVLF